MMPWTFPAPDAPPQPENVKKDGYSRAGVRCLKRFRGEIKDKTVPWILYTILNRDDISKEIGRIEHTSVMSKERPMADLVREIGDLCDPWPESADEETNYLSSFPDLAQSIKDGLQTPLNECEPMGGL